jgi:hypothetical protein
MKAFYPQTAFAEQYDQKVTTTKPSWSKIFHHLLYEKATSDVVQFPVRFSCQMI